MKKLLSSRALSALMFGHVVGLALSALMFGQIFPIHSNRYIATANTTALTVQQPSANANQVLFETASIYCASACTVTPSWNGAAATTTALTIKKAPQVNQPPLAKAFTDSNVSGGTAGVVYNIPAGGTMLFDMSSIAMGTNGTGNNFTYTTNGTATISIQWREQ